MSDTNKVQLDTGVDAAGTIDEQDPVLIEEQAHLDKIYAKLSAMRDELAA